MQNRQEKLHNELLVIRSQQGDEEAFGDLVGLWQERMWRYAFKMTGSEAVAWDVVQETWASVVKGLKRLKDVSTFPCWLFRIVNNKFTDLARQKKRQSRLNGHLQENLKEEASPKVNEKADVLETALEKLPPERKALIMLRYSEDFSIPQISEVLEIPEGTVKSRLHRTVNELREIVERKQNE
ncbi:MAG: RNA polymerase sigma factor [Planctomycetota bacterium]|jgi:RNA polymerase sigma-70 factor (ECF subfamily)